MAKKPENWDSMTQGQPLDWERRAQLQQMLSSPKPQQAAPPRTLEQMSEEGLRARVTDASVPKDVATATAQLRLFERRIPEDQWPDTDELGAMNFSQLQALSPRGGNLSLPEVAAYAHAVRDRKDKYHNAASVAENFRMNQRATKGPGSSFTRVHPNLPVDLDVWRASFGKTPLNDETADAVIKEMGKMTRELDQAESVQARFQRMAERTLGMRNFRPQMNALIPRSELQRSAPAPAPAPAPTAPRELSMDDLPYTRKRLERKRAAELDSRAEEILRSVEEGTYQQPEPVSQQPQSPKKDKQLSDDEVREQFVRQIQRKMQAAAEQ
jgi:hypothetical protein